MNERTVEERLSALERKVHADAERAANPRKPRARSARCDKETKL